MRQCRTLRARRARYDPYARLRCSEKRHHAITRELLHHSAFGFHRRNHFSEELIQQPQQCNRIQLFRQGGETADILKQMLTSRRSPASGTRPLRKASATSRDTNRPNVSLTRSRSTRPVGHLVEGTGQESDLIIAVNLDSISRFPRGISCMALTSNRPGP